MSNFVQKKYKEFYEKNGYIPEIFNPYNLTEIIDVAPCLSTQCGSTTSSATVLICNKKYGNYGNVFDMENVFEEMEADEI
jgi:hypothetical protein